MRCALAEGKSAAEALDLWLNTPAANAESSYDAAQALLNAHQNGVAAAAVRAAHTASVRATRAGEVALRLSYTVCEGPAVCVRHPD